MTSRSFTRRTLLAVGGAVVKLLVALVALDHEDRLDGLRQVTEPRRGVHDDLVVAMEVAHLHARDRQTNRQTDRQTDRQRERERQSARAKHGMRR